MKFIRKIYFNKFVNRLNKNLKIGQKSYLAFLLVSVMIIAFSAYVLFSYHQIKDRELEMQNVYTISNNTYALTVLLEKQIILLEKEKVEILKNDVKRVVNKLNQSIKKTDNHSLALNLDLQKLQNTLYGIENLELFRQKSGTVINESVKSHVLQEIKKSLTDLAAYNGKINNTVAQFSESTNHIFRMKNVVIYIFLLSGLLGSVIIANFITYRITDPIEILKDNIEVLQNGDYDFENKFEVLDNDEIGDIAKGIDRIGQTIKETVNFTEKIGNNRFDSDLALNKKGRLGMALLSMRDNLRAVTEQNEKQKTLEEKRNWVIKGLAELGNILRKSSEEVEDYYFKILRTIVNYIGANQGGFFIIKQEGNEKFLELSASYAYNRRKYLNKKIEIGEGLVGQCAFEKEITNLTEIPDQYVQITSGLGGSNPRNLVLVPLVLNGEIFGVIELASFEKYDEFRIDYLKQSAESIASELSNIQINHKTKELLQKTQVQAEEIASREEEMRQNMEELQATQEESQRKAEQQEKIIAELRSKIELN